MNEKRQPPVRYIDRTKAQYDALGYDSYHWAHIDEPPPISSLPAPLSELRLGLIATGGIYAQGQTAFTYRDDITYRAIDADVDPGELRATHFAYDLTDARQDINVVFPIDTLRSLVADGVVGERRHPRRRQHGLGLEQCVPLQGLLGLLHLGPLVSSDDFDR